MKQIIFKFAIILLLIIAKCKSDETGFKNGNACPGCCSNHYIPGPPGLSGPKGDTGPQGNTGPSGPQGVQGNPGSQGNQGPVGSPGLTGATGPIGPPGAQGISGSDASCANCPSFSDIFPYVCGAPTLILFAGVATVTCPVGFFRVSNPFCTLPTIGGAVASDTPAAQNNVVNCAYTLVGIAFNATACVFCVNPTELS